MPSTTLANKIERIASCGTLSSLKVLLQGLRGDTCNHHGAGLERFGQMSGTPGKLCTLKMAIEFNEANEYRSRCLRRLHLAELVGEYLRAQATAECWALSPDVRSLPQKQY